MHVIFSVLGKQWENKVRHFHPKLPLFPMYIGKTMGKQRCFDTGFDRVLQNDCKDTKNLRFSEIFHYKIS